MNENNQEHSNNDDRIIVNQLMNEEGFQIEVNSERDIGELKEEKEPGYFVSEENRVDRQDEENKDMAKIQRRESATVPKEVEPESPQPQEIAQQFNEKDILKNGCYFYAMIVWLVIGHWICGFNQLFMMPFLYTIANSANFDWGDESSSTFSTNAGIVTSFHYLGMFFANLSYGFFTGYSQRKFLIVCHISILVMSFVLWIPNTYCLFVSRFIIGYICGLIRPPTANLCYMLSPPELRGKSMNIYGIAFQAGIIIATKLAIFDNEGFWNWRVFISLQSIPSIVFIVQAQTVYNSVEAPIQMLANGEEERCKKLVGHYLREDYQLFMINSFKEVLKQENDFKEETKGKSCGVLRFVGSHYSKEFTYGIVMAITTALCFFNCYESFAMLLLVKDSTSDSEKKQVKYLLLAFNVLIIIVGLCTMFFKLNERRKPNFLIGHGLFGLVWVGMSISYMFDSFWFPKLSGFIVALCIGASTITTFNVIVTDVCHSSVVALTYAVFILTNFIVLMISPFMLQKNKDYRWYSLGCGIITLSLTIIGIFNMIETKGQEKKHIYLLLRKKHTRKSLIAMAKDTMEKIRKGLTGVRKSILGGSKKGIPAPVVKSQGDIDTEKKQREESIADKKQKEESIAEKEQRDES